MKSLLQNKVCVITGASGGIGSSIAKLFAAQGARVISHYFKGEEHINRLLNELNGNGHIKVQADLREEDQVEKMWQHIGRECGAVDVLVANAGIWQEKHTPLHKMSLQQWQNTMNTNLTSMFLCLRAFFLNVEKYAIVDPSAVLIGSTAGIYGEAGHADYAASKAAAIYGLMATLKNELPHIALRGRINAICPSWTLTPMVAEFGEDSAQVRRTLQTVALRKLALPEDIAQSALFLSSVQMSGHLSGQILQIAGGMEGRVLYEKDEIDLARVPGLKMD